MGVANLYKLKSSLPMTRTRIIKFRRWNSSLSSVNSDNKDVKHELYRSATKRLSAIMLGSPQLQNKNITDPSASSFNSSLSIGRAPHSGSMCKRDSPSVDQSKCDEIADSAEIINESEISCGTRSHSSDKALGIVEVCKSSNKTSPAKIDQSKSDDSAENINDSGSSREARDYSSEKALAAVEVYRSSNKTSLASAPSVSAGNCKRDTESIKDILTPTKSSCNLPDHSEKRVPCICDLDNPKQNETKGTLKFVPPGTEKDDIVRAFLGWADIMKVEIVDDGAVYRHACIYFKNKEDLLKSLKRTDLIVRNRTVVLEAASPMENVCNKLPEPVVIGKEPVSSKIIKKASRTVMIRGIGCQISLRDIRKVLAFCGGNMSGIFFGPSSFSAYVEFETEDDKEIALAKQPVCVTGKQISILRIDTPRTTVVRILYGHISGQKVSSICSSLGKVKHFNWRCHGIVDVHYCFTEWVKMVEILNSLNGLDLDGSRILAQPATDYPTDILSTLWNLPEERKHIRKMVLDLLERLRKKDAETVKLSNLADKYYNNRL